MRDMEVSNNKTMLKYGWEAMLNILRKETQIYAVKKTPSLCGALKAERCMKTNVEKSED